MNSSGKLVQELTASSASAHRVAMLVVLVSSIDAWVTLDYHAELCRLAACLLYTMFPGCRARDKADNEIVALKKIKLNPQHFRVEGFPMTSVREINILLTMDHPNIVNVSEVVTGFKKDGSQDVYMVMEFVQQDLKSFLGKYQARLKIGEVRPV